MLWLILAHHPPLKNQRKKNEQNREKREKTKKATHIINKSRMNFSWKRKRRDGEKRKKQKKDEGKRIESTSNSLWKQWLMHLDHHNIIPVQDQTLNQSFTPTTNRANNNYQYLTW